MPGADDALFTKYSGGGYPFLDIAGHWVDGTLYLPSALAGKTQAQVASTLTNTSDPITKDVIGSANMITAQICQATQGQPGNVCTSSGVTAAAKALGIGSGS